MQEVKDTKPTPPKKPLIFYYLIAMVVVMLLNALLFPAVMEKQVVEVSYDQFLTMVDNGQVSEVAWEKEEEQIVFIAQGDDGREGYYRTGVWPDDGQRLLQQLRNDPNIRFAASIPTQASPLLSFVVTWVLPILFFIAIGELLSRWMVKRMGGGMGNAMTFGKSGAKIYV